MKIEEIIKRLSEQDTSLWHEETATDVYDLIDGYRQLEADKLEASKVIVSLIDYGECDDLGFSVEELYNKYLGERSERD